MHDSSFSILFSFITSYELSVTPGLSQDIHLETFLFILYVNGLLSVIEFSHIADDVKPFSSFSLEWHAYQRQIGHNTVFIKFYEIKSKEMQEVLHHKKLPDLNHFQ